MSVSEIRLSESRMSENLVDKMPPKVILIERDEDSRNAVANAIERYWFNVIRISDPEIAIRSLFLHQPHLAVISSRLSLFLDLSPVSEGPPASASNLVDMVNRIRSTEGFANIPIVLLLEENDRYGYSELGNDLIELVYRPFSHSELILSIKSLFRKSNPVLQNRILKYKDVSMDLGSYKVIRQDKQVHLGPTEFKILQLLIQTPKSIFSRAHIIDYVWKEDTAKIGVRTVDVHMNRLRTALKRVSSVPMIQTIRASGYCLSLPGDPD
jgi:two-component system phosphate regulon response regulator PhoB